MEDIKLGTLYAGIDLDASGLEDGATRAERRYASMVQSIQAQENYLQAQATAMDRLGASIDNQTAKLKALKEQYGNLTAEERFGQIGAELQKTIDDLSASIQTNITRIDGMNAEYAKSETQLGKTKQKASELQAQIQQTSQTKDANQNIKETNLELSALSGSIYSVGQALGVDSTILSGITRSISVYKQAVSAAKGVDEAHTTAIAAKNAVISMGASVLVLIISKLVEYAVSASDAEGSTQSLTTRVKELREAYDSAVESIENSSDKSRAEIEVVDELIDEYDELNNKAELTQKEKKRLAEVASTLQLVYDDLEWSVDSVTGKWNIQTEAILRNRDAMMANIEMQHSYQKATEAYDSMQNVLEEAGVSSYAGLLKKKSEIARTIGWYEERTAPGGSHSRDKQAHLLKQKAYRDYAAIEEVIEAYKTYQSDYERYIDGATQSTDQETIDLATGTIYQTEEEYNERIAKLNKAREDRINDHNEQMERYREEEARAAEQQAKEQARLAEQAAREEQRALEAKRKAEEEYRKQLESGFDDMTDALVTAIKERYNQMLEAERESIQQSVDNWKRWEEENVSAIQSEIDALDALEEKEENEAKAAELKQKADTIAYQLRFETDEYNRQELEKAYNSAMADYEQELADQERAALKKSLQQQIEDVKEISQAKQNELADQLTKIEDTYAAMTESAALETEAQKMILSNAQDDILAMLKTYNPEYFNLGQSLGQRLAEGMSNATLEGIINNIQNAANSVLSQMAAAADATTTRYWNSTGGSAGGSSSANRSVTIGDVYITTKSGSPAEIAAEMDKFANNLATLLQ